MPIPVEQKDLEVRLQDLQSAFPAVSASVEAGTNHFADLLADNEEYRKQQSYAWEKREREDKARKTLAAISDALSSLGNLVGTAHNASSQPQTYQMPFVQQDIEKERALARNTADRIRATEQSLRSAEASYSSSNPFALENLRHQHTMEQINARGVVNSALEELRQAGRVALKDMYYAYKGDYDKMMADLRRQGIQISRERLDEAIRHNMTMEELKREGSSGNVGEYTTVTTPEYDSYGRKIRETKTRTKGGTTTTTTTAAPSGGKKANPMGGSPAKGKKKNPMS